MIRQKLFILQAVDKLKKDTFKVANKFFKSRLIVGTGKYKSFTETAKAIQASGADMVTVAVRRVNILDKKPILTDYLNPKITLLPNTAIVLAPRSIKNFEASKRIRMEIVKLEVLGDKTLYPNVRNFKVDRGSR